MKEPRRLSFWIDAPLQFQMLGFVLVLVGGSLLLAAFSVVRGLEDASARTHQIYHSMDWVRQTLRGPLILSSSISILASALLTLLWSHRYAGPLRVLSAAMGRLREGDLASPVRVRATDAHQDLVKEFSGMQQHLRGMIEEDRKHAAELGRRLESALENLPKDHPSHHALQTLSHELKAVCSHYRL